MKKSHELSRIENAKNNIYLNIAINSYLVIQIRMKRDHIL